MRPDRRQREQRRRAFSLIELVIVVVIVGIIGAIAIPRLSRGSSGANLSKLKQDLAVMNKAVDLYAAEHGGQFPSLSQVEDQLTQYTSPAGAISSTRDTTHYLGPYLRHIPPAPSGANPGSARIGAKPLSIAGWLYDSTNGRIHLNRGVAIDLNTDDVILNQAVQDAS